MGFLVALFVPAALVWLLPILRNGRLLPIVLIVVVSGVVFGPAFFSIDGPLQISIDRLMLVVLGGVVLIRLRLGQVAWLKLTRLDWLILGALAYLLWSCMRGGPVPDGSVPLARWIFFAAVPVAVYFACRHIRPTPTDLRRFENAMIALGAYLSFTAVLEVTGHRQLVFPGYINDPEIWEFFGRGRGPLLNPAGNGMLITLGLTISSVRWFVSGRQGKVIHAILVALMMAGIYATLTRSAWLGAAAALGLVALVYTPRWLRVLGLAFAILLAGGMVLGIKDQLLSMKRDKNLSASEAAKSVELRPLLAIVAWEMFKDQPLTGHGYGHYFEHSPPYHAIREYGLPLEKVRPYVQHNVFLSVLVDTGLVGIGCLLGAMCTVLGMAARLAMDTKADQTARTLGLATMGYIAGYVCNGLFHDVGVIDMVNTFLLAIAGLAAAAYQHGVRETRQSDVRSNSVA
ncbi:MAG: O-antigen ligase family protein, partial [Planctomycetota bacterium]